MTSADIQIDWENSNDACDSNRFHNLLLICSCFESCLASTSDSPSAITSTTIDYTEDSDSDIHIPIEIVPDHESTKILKNPKKIDPWLKKLSKSNSRSMVPKGKQYYKKMKSHSKITKKGNFRKK